MLVFNLEWDKLQLLLVEFSQDQELQMMETVQVLLSTQQQLE